MPWTDPAGHDYAVSEVLTAATMDTYVRENLSALGAALLPGGVGEFWLPATRFKAARGTPAEAVVGSGGNELRVDAWALDQTADEAVVAFERVPFDPSKGTITAKLYWAPSSTNTGQVSWSVTLADVSNGQQIDQAAEDTLNAQQAADGTIDNLHELSMGTSARTGRFWRIAVKRDGSGTIATDSFTADAYFLGLLLTFTPT